MDGARLAAQPAIQPPLRETNQPPGIAIEHFIGYIRIAGLQARDYIRK